MSPTEDDYKEPDVRRKLAILAILIILPGSQAIARKKLDWQTGKLTRINSKVDGAVALPIAGMIVAKQIREWVYVVETDSMIYQFERKSQSPLNVTVNAHVKFAVEKSGKAFLLDDAGKRYRVVILRKIAKDSKP